MQIRRWYALKDNDVHKKKLIVNNDTIFHTKVAKSTEIRISLCIISIVWRKIERKTSHRKEMIMVMMMLMMIHVCLLYDAYDNLMICRCGVLKWRQMVAFLKIFYIVAISFGFYIIYCYSASSECFIDWT